MTPKRPRTMTAEREHQIREIWDTGTSGELLLRELTAERFVADELAMALQRAREALSDCVADTAGTRTHAFFIAQVQRCDAALARWSGGAQIIEAEVRDAERS